LNPLRLPIPPLGQRKNYLTIENSYVNGSNGSLMRSIQQKNFLLAYKLNIKTE